MTFDAEADANDNKQKPKASRKEQQRTSNTETWSREKPISYTQWKLIASINVWLLK